MGIYIVALTLGSVLPILIQKLFIRFNKFDDINHRSSHNAIATRTGGIGLFLSLFGITIYQYALGEEIYAERCAACHGDFGEGIDRWPVLAGGQGTLDSHDPVKTVGSYWPYASTIYDYVYRAMPFGEAQSLTHDETYSVVAYLLFMNDVIEEEDMQLSNANIGSIKMPNRDGFMLPDPRPDGQPQGEPCMKNCSVSTKIIGKARNIDVTPES